MEACMRTLRAKSIAAISVAALVGAVAFTGSTAAQAAAPKSITVWLMPDAKDFGTALEDANAAFTAAYPNTKVIVEFQTWGDHLKKLDASLVAKKGPDVVEFGNTEVMKYSAAGALASLSSYKPTFGNSATWLKALEDAGSYNGKLYAVPYYAGARAIMYRPSLFKAQGISVPKSYAEFLSAGKKLMDAYGTDKDFSAVYLPGKYWYAAMSFVYDEGGAIATKSGGKWVGSLDSDAAIRGLNRFKEVSDLLSKADKSGTEAAQWDVFNGGKVAMSYSNGWESCCIPKVGADWGFFPMPSVKAGKASPAFLGGSNLAVPSYTANVKLAATWIRYYTNATQMKTIAQSGAIPNNTKMLSLISGAAAPVAAAAKNSWFVPGAIKWVDVENANTLQTMLADIATGKKTVAKAAADASAEITKLLN
ncbi:MAG: extracellular solute-binding protein [Streptomycetaceae bacterium]|jgi:N,N'-diacetylchitobiose transport system substrate-binding protein|nr:MAG: extracellular solute-binding protein [Streptomycetaceae bacterium]